MIVYVKPCETVLAKINDEINHFVNDEILSIFGSESKNKNLSYKYDFLDEDQDEFDYELSNVNVDKWINDENSLINDVIDENDPDDEEIAEFTPQRNPKTFQVIFKLSDKIKYMDLIYKWMRSFFIVWSQIFKKYMTKHRKRLNSRLPFFHTCTSY